MQPSSGREALPAFAPASLQDRASAARAHPRPEPVGLGPLSLLRLIGALHWPSQYTDACRYLGTSRHSPAENLSSGICGPASIRPRMAAAMVARRCPTTPLDRTSTPFGGRSNGGCAQAVPELDLQALAGAAAARSARRVRRSTSPRRRESAPGSSVATRRCSAKRLLLGDASLSEIAFAEKARSTSRRARPGARQSSSTPTTPSSGSSSARATGSPTPPPWRSPRRRPRPTTRSSCTARRGSARRTCSARSPTTCAPTRPGSASATRPPSRFTNEFVAALRSQRRRGVQEPLPRPRRAARRRRPVPRGQTAHRRGVLPHLQRPL